MSLVDVTTLRTLTGMAVTAPAEQILSEEQMAQLGTVDEDALFGGGDTGRLVQEVVAGSAAPVLLDLGEREETMVDSGAWHFLLLKLRRPGAAGRVTDDLERAIGEADLNAQVLGWVEAAAPLSQLSDGFNVVIIVIAVVAVIIIMNTLVISVTERISEIGTMWAIGARKGFVRRMIGAETVTLACVFGAVGVLLALVLLFILGATGIRAATLTATLGSGRF